MSLPGSLTSVCMQGIMDPEEGFGSSNIHGYSQIPTKLPLAYYYGYQSPTDNPTLYRKYVSRLALAVTSRLDEDVEGAYSFASQLSFIANISGCIIDTSGVLDQSIGSGLIRDIVAEFAVTAIVVLGHERLYNDIVRQYSGKSAVSVVKLAKSGGVVELNDTYIQHFQAYITKQYFYGEWKTILSPISSTLDFKNLKVYRLDEGSSFLWLKSNV